MSGREAILVDMDVELDSAEFITDGPARAEATRREVRDILARHTEAEDRGRVELALDERTGIATILLDTPAKCNALSGNMFLQLDAALTTLEGWNRGRGLLIRGKTAMFCSGADLALIKSLHACRDGVTVCAFAQKLLTRLNALPLLTAALVRGSALGGGAELATAADFRLMSRDATFGFVQVQMGITTAFGGGTLLVRRLGRAAALDVLTSCSRYSAQEATALGWADAVVPEGDAGVAAAQAWLARRCRGHPEVIRATKSIVVEAERTLVRASMEHELNCLSSVWGGPAQILALNNAHKHTK